MAQRTTEKQLKSMVAVINNHYQITMHGRAHRLFLNRGINGYELAWMDTDKHTLSAHLVPWTALTASEAWCVIKTIMDNLLYVEQSGLTVNRVYK
jgi:hypothetical protein